MSNTFSVKISQGNRNSFSPISAQAGDDWDSGTKDFWWRSIRKDEEQKVKKKERKQEKKTNHNQTQQN